jgi:Flp pilus assembly protein TadG
MNHSNSTARRTRSARGQAIAEFALVLPLVLGIVGAGIDFSRAFAASMALTSATRNAAEAAAYESLDLAAAQSTARAVACTEAQHQPGFVPGGGGDVETCTNPVVSVTYSRDETAPGANTRYPLVTVTVTTSMDFGLAVPWPFIPNQTWNLGTTQSFQILQGR